MLLTKTSLPPPGSPARCSAGRPRPRNQAWRLLFFWPCPAVSYQGEAADATREVDGGSRANGECGVRPRRATLLCRPGLTTLSVAQDSSVTPQSPRSSPANTRKVIRGATFAPRQDWRYPTLQPRPTARDLDERALP
jgi:hypothetical protein